MRSLAVLALLAACSYDPARSAQVGDDARPPDANVVTDTPVDGFMGPPPTACVAKWLAGTMSLTTPGFVEGDGIQSTIDDRDPFVSADGRVLYFVSPSLNSDEIFFATRGQASGPFDDLQIKAISDPNAADGKVSITGDDLTAFVSTRRPGGSGGYDLWQASRATGFAAPFGALSQEGLGALADADDQVDPHISADGLRLYYATGMPQQIVVAERTSVTAAFQAPVPLAVVNGTTGDADPTLTEDERVLIFTSNRDSAANASQMFYATRAERDQPFGQPMPLSINTIFQDGDPHISPDGCTLYFASTREGSGDYDLMVTTVQ